MGMKTVQHTLPRRFYHKKAVVNVKIKIISDGKSLIIKREKAIECLLQNECTLLLPIPEELFYCFHERTYGF